MKPAITARIIWISAFSGVFLLSQDFWVDWGDPVALGPWNFPLRIFYFLVLQFVLAIILAVFLARRPQHQPDIADQDN